MALGPGHSSAAFSTCLRGTTTRTSSRPTLTAVAFSPLARSIARTLFSTAASAFAFAAAVFGAFARSPFAAAAIARTGAFAVGWPSTTPCAMSSAALSGSGVAADSAISA